MSDFAKIENGQLLLKEAGEWVRHSGLYARSFAMSLRASDAQAHHKQIAEIESALEEIAHANV